MLHRIELMKIVSVILARGGSKGIPNKNIIDVNGNPLIYYTILASQASRVNNTWVCTDSNLIGTVAEELGASVLMRPKELATDERKSEDSLLYFANEIEFDILVFIQPTSPLLTHEYIDVGIAMVDSNKFDSVFSAYREHWLPRWNKTETICPIGWSPKARPRRQDVPDIWVENGALYVTTKKQLLQSKLRYGGTVGIVEMPYSKSFQVDSMDDLNIIKKLL